MAGETTLTVEGNLTADPELRFTQSGAAVCSFTVASTPRTFDKASGQWKDGEALFMRCNVWRQMAENVAESLSRGDGVVVMGFLKQRSFTTGDGEKRTVIEMDAQNVGPSLKWATAKVSKVSRESGGGGGGWNSGGQQQGQQQRQSGPPANDPWGSSPPPSGGGSGFADEPPF
jgi:single-strand DNA-binding protein